MIASLLLVGIAAMKLKDVFQFPQGKSVEGSGGGGGGGGGSSSKVSKVSSLSGSSSSNNSEGVLFGMKVMGERNPAPLPSKSSGDGGGGLRYVKKKNPGRINSFWSEGEDYETDFSGVSGKSVVKKGGHFRGHHPTSRGPLFTNVLDFTEAEEEEDENFYHQV